MNEVTVRILENKPVAAGIYKMTFALPVKVEGISCGKFVNISVGDGAHLLRRPIAVCEHTEDAVTICYQLKGEGTKLMSGKKAGDTLSCVLPLGNGFYVKENEKKIAVVGGGVGIFPLISAIREYSRNKQVYAYMGFRNRAAVCMEYDMTRGEKLVIATDDGSAGFHGTSVQAFMQDVDMVCPDVVLACGPTPMLRALKVAMKGRDIPVYVSLEERMGCGIGACLVCVCEKTDGAHARVCKDGPVFDVRDVEL